MRWWCGGGGGGGRGAENAVAETVSGAMDDSSVRRWSGYRSPQSGPACRPENGNKPANWRQTAFRGTYTGVVCAYGRGWKHTWAARGGGGAGGLTGHSSMSLGIVMDLAAIMLSRFSTDSPKVCWNVAGSILLERSRSARLYSDSRKWVRIRGLERD